MTRRGTAHLLTNWGAKVISVVIAVVLWVVVLGSRNVEATKEVPIEVITPTELTVANDIPEKVLFRLSGPKAFLRAILDRREDPIRVNLAGAKPGLVTYRFFSDNIHLPIGVKVQSITPPAIPIKLEAIKKREIPVKVELRGVPPEGYRVVRTEVVPDRVKVRGAETRIDALTEVPTLPIDVATAKSTFQKEVPLDLNRLGLQLDGEAPKLTVYIEASGANFRLRNVDVRVQTNHKFSIEEKTVAVLVRAAPEDLKSLDRSQVYGTVDLRGRPKGKYLEWVRMSLPENIGLVRVIPDKVNITLY